MDWSIIRPELGIISPYASNGNFKIVDEKFGFKPDFDVVIYVVEDNMNRIFRKLLMTIIVTILTINLLPIMEKRRHIYKIYKQEWKIQFSIVSTDFYGGKKL